MAQIRPLPVRNWTGVPGDDPGPEPDGAVENCPPLRSSAASIRPTSSVGSSPPSRGAQARSSQGSRTAGGGRQAQGLLPLPLHPAPGHPAGRSTRPPLEGDGAEDQLPCSSSSRSHRLMVVTPPSPGPGPAPAPGRSRTPTPACPSSPTAGRAFPGPAASRTPAAPPGESPPAEQALGQGEKAAELGVPGEGTQGFVPGLHGIWIVFHRHSSSHPGETPSKGDVGVHLSPKKLCTKRHPQSVLSYRLGGVPILGLFFSPAGPGAAACRPSPGSPSPTAGPPSRRVRLGSGAGDGQQVPLQADEQGAPVPFDAAVPDALPRLGHGFVQAHPAAQQLLGLGDILLGGDVVLEGH